MKTFSHPTPHREISRFAREQQAKQAERKANTLTSLERWYHDQVAVLDERLREQQTTQSQVSISISSLSLCLFCKIKIAMMIKKKPLRINSNNNYNKPLLSRRRKWSKCGGICNVALPAAWHSCRDNDALLGFKISFFLFFLFKYSVL